jgi:bacillithiol system protein YtxJ
MHTTVMINLFTENALDDLLQTSAQNPSKIYAIFKHSTRCNISSMALNRMDKTDFFEKQDVPFYYLDLIQFRNVSNYVAQQLQVEHESPQLLIIKNGKCMASETHNGIRESWLLEVLTTSNTQ